MTYSDLQTLFERCYVEQALLGFPFCGEQPECQLPQSSIEAGSCFLKLKRIGRDSAPIFDFDGYGPESLTGYVYQNI
jgi:hypothetical protein